jgi:PAS domain S-box-containing protein
MRKNADLPNYIPSGIMEEKGRDGLVGRNTGDTTVPVNDSGLEGALALRDADQTYRIILETLDEGVAVITPRGMVLYCNRRLAEILNMPGEKIRGRMIADFCPNEYHPLIMSLVRQDPGGRSKEEIRLRDPAGGMIPVQVSCSGLHLKSSVLCLIFTDLRGLKAAQADLEKANALLEKMVRKRTRMLLQKNLSLRKEISRRNILEQKLGRLQDEAEIEKKRLESILEIIPSGVIMISDPGRRIVYANKRVMTLFGADDALGCDFIRWSHFTRIKTMEGTPYSAENLPAVRALAKGESVFNEELIFEQQSGTSITVSTSAVPLFDKRGRLVAGIAVFDDVTSHKLAEQVLKRDKETLEDLIKKRTDELLSAQAELKKKERLSEIGTLAATVAHELRNPLAVIGIIAYNLNRETRDRPELARYIEDIEKKISQSSQIIDNLLSYSRIKLPQYENVPVYELINSCLLETKEYFKDKDVRLTVNVSTLKQKPLRADLFQVNQILNNVLRNAWEAAPRSGGKIDVSGGFENGRVVIKIKDNGHGIPAEHIDNVFKPFFTLKSKGTGLGLAVCREMIHLHDGKIELASTQGKGTTVTLHLPQGVPYE